MKKIQLLLALLLPLLSIGLSAQAPTAFQYQSIIRDAQGEALMNQAVSLQFIIRKGSESGSAVYTETQNITTNDFGLVNLQIGMGTSSDDLSSINWANDKHYLEIGLDLTGGSNYTTMGTAQLLSAPYALHANTAKDLSEVPDIVKMAIKDTASQIRAAITNELPSSGNTGDMAYWDGSQWVTIPAGGEGQVLTFKNGAPAWDGLLEGEVLSSTGKIWMDRNLGASQVATSSTDTDAFGDLYQWGRGTDGHEKRTSGTTSTLANSDTPGHGDFITVGDEDWRNPENNNLWQGVYGTNNPCPEGYRIPTVPEWQNETDTWTAGAFDTPLKLPLAGARRRTDGAVIDVGSGYYWTSTVHNEVGGKTYSFQFIDIYFFPSQVSPRANGFSVRCIKD